MCCWVGLSSGFGLVFSLSLFSLHFFIRKNILSVATFLLDLDLCYLFIIFGGSVPSSLCTDSLTVVSRSFSLAAGNTSFLRQWILLRSSGSRVCGPQWLPHAGSVVVVHKLSCPMACGFLPEQGSNLHRLQWQADSQPRDHQGGRLEFKLTWLIDSRLALVLSYIHRESRSVGSLVSLGLGFLISWLVI